MKQFTFISDAERQRYQERVAIMIFDAGLSETEAKLEAYKDILKIRSKGWFK